MKKLLETGASLEQKDKVTDSSVTVSKNTLLHVNLLLHVIITKHKFVIFSLYDSLLLSIAGCYSCALGLQRWKPTCPGVSAQ